jgi:NADH:ubiquinone oxidoreductase subunit 5 (subunit L)/multisubunit Na+/H+ antiporter MnhA subunit
MIGDSHYTQFYVTLELFAFTMNLLVISKNVVLLFFSWELVGLCSYLLINYWKLNQNSNLSSIKAVLYNKLGDIFLLILIGRMFQCIYSCDIHLIFISMVYFSFFSWYWMNPIHILSWSIIIAAFTKSTKVPFSGWIADAMAAPTPVSALLHSATMVTAGVFLILRF